MIKITSIIPLKNATDVPIDQDLEIKVHADFKMDPRNVSFTLNGVEVVPNVFSVYVGETAYDLIITLYTKRRIKFGTEKRYGEGYFYGERDNQPSMLEYDSRYVCQFTVWGTNESGNEERITDSFAFNTVAGIFYNSNPATYFYNNSSQSVANYFPEWSKSRYDKYSNLQQLINPVMESLDSLKFFIKKDKINNYIQTTNLTELNKLYKVELDKDYEIKTILNEDGSLFYIPPSISGVQDVTRFDIFTSENNDLKSFYYDKMPTRIGARKEDLKSNILLPETIAEELKKSLSITLERPGTICLYVENLSSSIVKTETTAIVPVKCRIFGIGLFDNEQVEDILLLNEQNLYTRKEWKSLTGIAFSNLPNKEIIYTISHFRNPMTPCYDLMEMVSAEDNKEIVIWNMDQRNQKSYLQLLNTVGETSAEVLRYAGAMIPVRELELIDIDNVSPLQLIDIAPDKFSNLVYGVDQNYLYIFDKREPYPERLKEISGNNGLADFVIELDTNEIGLDEDGEKEVLFKCIHRKPGRNIIRYRIRIRNPDGTFFYIKENNEITTDGTLAAIVLSQTDIVLEEKQYSFVLNKSGDYIIELETVYKGGLTSTHKQLVRVLKTAAIVKYRLRRILGDARPISIFFDHDQQLKILSSDSTLNTLILRKDGVLIDYENKILYFSEEYSSIDVE